MRSVEAVNFIKTVQQAFQVIAALQLTAYLWPQQAQVSNGDEFDFIVVGAGAAGSVVASRLAQDRKTRVLLIEAGGDPPIESNIPSLLMFLEKSHLDWNYTTDSDSSFSQQCQKGGRVNLMLGKMLGGSSGINYLLYSQGNYRDYDNWAKITGDSTWSWDEVLPYFIKSQRLKEPAITMSSSKSYYGTEGPIGITRDAHVYSNDTYLKGFEEAGNKINEDYNAKNQIGYSRSLYTLADDTRQSTAYAYLRLFKDNPNFYVFKNTMATKVLFDDNKNAIGVEAVNENGEKMTIKAAKEVIVSAGTINSPKFLMLSGIGPKEHLESQGIPVISDLPVGKNYHDHVAAVVIYNMTNLNGPILPRNPGDFPAFAFTGYVNLDKSKDYPEYSTVNYVNYAVYLVQFCTLPYGLSDEICNNMFSAPNTNEMIFTVVTNLHPKSRGEILLRSSNYEDSPIVKTNYLSETEDLENLVKYVEDYVRVTNTSRFKEAGAELVDPKLSGCSEYTFGSTDYWRCYIRCMLATRRHYAGTVPMGTVLDSRLRVKGVNKLRVVDTSVMPVITRGDPYIPTVMIGEKAADFILQDNHIQ